MMISNLSLPRGIRRFWLTTMCAVVISCLVLASTPAADDEDFQFHIPTDTKKENTPGQSGTDSEVLKASGTKPTANKPTANLKKVPGTESPIGSELDDVKDGTPTRDGGDRAGEGTTAAAKRMGSGTMVVGADTWHRRESNAPRLAANLLERRVAARPIGADYKLRPGDHIRLVTWGGANFNELVLIDSAGTMGVPGFGVLPVAGRTQTEAQQALVDLIRSHFKQGGAVLGVEQAGAVSVTVTGEVPNPGFHSLPPGASLLDALAVAGGILPQGSVRRIVVADPGQPSHEVDLYSLAVEGQSTGIGPVANGILIFVPLRGPEVQVFGSVRRSAALELLAGDTLAKAIELAGGLTSDADPDVIRLAREGDHGQEIDQASLAAIATRPVRDGDRLYVVRRAALEQLRTLVTVMGQVRTPGTYAWQPGMTLGSLIELAGGTLPDAKIALSIVRRERATPIDMDLGGGLTVPILADLIAPAPLDTKLEPRDTAVIPAFPTPEQADLVVNVTGAVRMPGDLPLTPGMTAREALVLAGGVTANAQLDQADLIRVQLHSDGTRDIIRLPIDIVKVVSGQDVGVVLQARDQIVVRTRNDQRVTIVVQGEARNAGTFTLPHGTTVSQLMIIAGGLTSDAFPAGIRLFRETEKEAGKRFLEEMRSQVAGAAQVNRQRMNNVTPGDETQELQLTIANQEADLARMKNAVATGRLTGLDFPGLIAGRRESDLELRNGDRIEIPVRPDAVRVLGEVMSPGSLRFEPGQRVQAMIARSGGFTQQADRRRIFVVRANGAVVATATGNGVAWDSAKRNWRTTDLDSILMEEGDAVIVPPDLTYKPSWRIIAKDLTQILFNVSVAAATVIAIAP